MALEYTQLLKEIGNKSYLGKERQEREADNLIAIREPTVYNMWEPQRLSTIWATTTSCYRDTIFF
jgi:hypothetical protein